jgi:hypothetical protein
MISFHIFQKNFVISVINFTLVAKETVERRPKSSRVPVTVFIRDMNDNFPEFTKPVYEVGVNYMLYRGSKKVSGQSFYEGM